MLAYFDSITDAWRKSEADHQAPNRATKVLKCSEVSEFPYASVRTRNLAFLHSSSSWSLLVTIQIDFWFRLENGRAAVRVNASS
jgi:hypothetical protein